MAKYFTEKRDFSGKKLELLIAAENVFSNHGYAATRMDEVAAEAGVSKGSVYNYFQSKQEMFMEVFLYSQTKDRHVFDEILDSTALSPRQKILKIIEVVFMRFDSHSRIGKLLMEFWASAGRDDFSEINDVINELYKEYLSVLTELLIQGQASGEITLLTTPEMSARMLVAFLDGLGLQKLLGVGGEWRQQDFVEIMNTINKIMGQQGMY